MHSPSICLAVKATLDELRNEEVDLIPGSWWHSHAFQCLLITLLHSLQHTTQIHQFLLVQANLPLEVVNCFAHCEENRKDYSLNIESTFPGMEWSLSSAGNENPINVREKIHGNEISGNRHQKTSLGRNLLSNTKEHFQLTPVFFPSSFASALNKSICIFVVFSGNDKDIKDEFEGGKEWSLRARFRTFLLQNIEFARNIFL